MNYSDKTMTRYLLGELSEVEQASLEETYFTDHGVFDQVVKVEHQLVDDYARNQLSPQARARFEQFYLAHSKRRERMEFAETLAAKLDQSDASRTVDGPAVKSTSWLAQLLESLRGQKMAWAFSMAIFLILAGGVWFLAEKRRLHRDLAKAQAERTLQETRDRQLEQQAADERLRAAQRSAELDRLRAQQQSNQALLTAVHRPLVSLVLSVAGLRTANAAPPAVLVIPSGTDQVRLQLNLKETDYSSYRAVLQTADGKEVFIRQKLTARANKSGASLVFLVPANKFSTGDYILRLRGINERGETEDVSTSLFRAVKK